jgi:hypothetical protein
MSQDINRILAELQSQWYTTITSDIPSELLHNCITAFRDFIASAPTAEKETTDFRYDPTQRFSLGFRDKSTSEGFDEKCYFHFNPHIIEKGFLPDSIAYERFLNAMEVVYRSLDIVIHEIADGLIANGYARRESFYSELWETNSNLRILQYRPKDTCTELAKPHTDRGIFTLAVYETDPGLRFYTPQWVEDMEYMPYTLKLFPADFWSRYVSLPLPWLTHDVIKKGSNHQRGSMVLFVNPSFGNGPHDPIEQESGKEY